MSAPQPGDVIDLGEEGRAVIDSHYFGEDLGDGPIVLAVCGASAFRSTDGRIGLASAIEATMTGGRFHPFVSCSGGPCPFVKLADLEHVGEVTQRFWRWKDLPRVGGGVDYTEVVQLFRRRT